MDKNIVLRGPRLVLRSVEESHVTDRYVAWMNDPVVTRHMGWRDTVSTRESVLEYVRKMRACPDTLFLALEAAPLGLHIGNLRLGPVDCANGRAELAMMIGDRSYWSKGYMTEAFGLIASHAFQTLGLRKLKAGTEADNEAAVRLFRKTGWVDEGRLRDEILRDGRPVDMFQFALFNPGVAER